MKKINDFEEFLNLLEEAVNKIVDENATPEKRPVNISININLYPVMAANPGDILVQQEKMPVDILETSDKIHAVMPLPGMEMENIKIICSGKSLEIMAVNSENTFREIIELPSKVNRKGIVATCKNGILEVVLNKPKSERKKLG
ncbi:MAG TPA: Hsp20/alpha crystallin family protein [Candidatus Methanoperedens sp.]|jgi:HSP20 family molecular chaperone IbpA